MLRALTGVVGLVTVAVMLAAPVASAAPDWSTQPTMPNPGFVDNGAGGYTLSAGGSTLVRSPGYTGSFVAADGSVSTSAYTEVEKARQAGRFTPTMRGLGAAGLVIAVSAGAGTLFSSAISMSIPGQGTIYRLVSGEEWDPAVPQTYSMNWRGGTAGTNTGQIVANPGVCQVQAAPCSDAGYNSIPFGNPIAGSVAAHVWTKTSGTYNSVPMPVPQAITVTASAACAGTFTITAATTNSFTMSGEPVGCTGSQSLVWTAPLSGLWYPPVGWYLRGAGTGTQAEVFCFSGAGTPQNYTDANAIAIFLSRPGTDIPITGGAGGACATASNYHFKVMTEAAVSARVNFKPTTAAVYAATATKVPVTYTVPTLVPADDQAAADSLGANLPAGSRSPAQNEAINKIAHDVDPAYEPGGGAVVPPAFASYVLPRPNQGERYDDYIDRLRAAGYIGDVVLADAVTTGYASGSVGDLAEAGTVTGVRVNAIGMTRSVGTTGAAQVWPATGAPTVTAADDAVTVEKKPGTLAPPSVPACECTIPAVDFSPLATLGGTCESFPFGVFCWVTDQLGDIFGAGEVAPHVTVGPHDFGVFLGVHVTLPELTYDFALLPPAVDGWRAVIRQVFAFFMVLGGLFYFATRMLGRREAPDPSGVDMGS